MDDEALEDMRDRDAHLARLSSRVRECEMRIAELEYALFGRSSVHKRRRRT